MAKFVRYNEVSLYRGTFVYIILHWGKNNLSLYGGSAVFLHASERPVADIDLQRMGGGREGEGAVIQTIQTLR